MRRRANISHLSASFRQVLLALPFFFSSLHIEAMPTLPPELIGLIVSEIEDVPTLKACSLTSSVFCESSRRILLRSIKLATQNSTHVLCTLLDNSPHLAIYVTRIYLQLRWDAPDIVFDHLQQIFSKLTNVRQCSILGMFWFRDGHESALFNFLERQPLRELNMHFIEVPLAGILRLLSAAPTLYCTYILFKERVDDLEASSSHNAPKIGSLMLDEHIGDLYKLLLRPQIKPYTQALRSLTMLAREDRDSKLLFQAAGTLEDITLNLEFLRRSDIILVPSLPRLRSLQFFMQFHNHTAPWFLRLLIAFLDASPLLADIRISFFPLTLRHTLDAQVMAALDDACARHPAGPMVQWRFAVRTEESGEEIVDSTTVDLCRGMPQMYAKRLLAVEARCVPRHNDDRWNF
ncbi:hypothetical protein C8R45DRAFT_565434 [Mycena sanguinolenta]|nr:hypothetical protein C8R45DRAFT_565434 [Mycena sanguinolenta]